MYFFVVKKKLFISITFFFSGYWMGIPMERATTAIRRIIQREMPDIDLRELNLAILARMKQIEAEVKLSNTEVILQICFKISVYM